MCHSSVPAPPAAQGGGKAACVEANGAVPVTFVPRTQSWLLFYSHEKLIWAVTISQSRFWYEAP